jgi:ketosteroid isomerase-like protein
MAKIKAHSLTGRITPDVMHTAFRNVKRNRGAAGIDRVSIKLVPRKIQVSGDVALVSNVATVVGATPDGSSVTTHTTEVLRRQPDGRWTYLIDDPFFG